MKFKRDTNFLPFEWSQIGIIFWRTYLAIISHSFSHWKPFSGHVFSPWSSTGQRSKNADDHIIWWGSGVVVVIKLALCSHHVMVVSLCLICPLLILICSIFVLILSLGGFLMRRLLLLLLHNLCALWWWYKFRFVAIHIWYLFIKILMLAFFCHVLLTFGYLLVTRIPCTFQLRTRQCKVKYDSLSGSSSAKVMVEFWFGILLENVNSSCPVICCSKFIPTDHCDKNMVAAQFNWVGSRWSPWVEYLLCMYLIWFNVTFLYYGLVHTKLLAVLHARANQVNGKSRIEVPFR